MRALILFLILCVPAVAQDAAKQKRDILQFYTRLTGVEKTMASIKRDTAAFARSESALNAAEATEKKLSLDLQAWGRTNMGPGKISPEVGNLYNELVRLLDTYALWSAAHHTFVMAGQAQDLKAMAAGEGKLYQEYQTQRDAWLALSKK